MERNKTFTFATESDKKKGEKKMLSEDPTNEEMWKILMDYYQGRAILTCSG